MLKVDMHVHTVFSPDALCSLKGIVKACERRGISCLAVTMPSVP